MPKVFPRVTALVLLTFCFGRSAVADHEHGSDEFEVFLAAEAIHGSGQTHPAEDDDTWFDADVVFALTQHQFRVFGEYYITPQERDMERLQFGYELVPDTMLWLGRFHQPGSAWNTEHHHGRYLQTAITRPFIERWEDEDGLIPQHITGALLESRRPLGAESAIQLSGGAGAGPGLTRDDEERHDELVPIDLIGSNPGRHRLSLTGRIAYLPEYVGTSSVGLLFGHDHISTASPTAFFFLGTTDLTLTVYGAYIDWNTGPWRVIGADYYVDVNFEQGHDESFDSGYLQVERQLPFKLTAFGRVEASARMQESRYVRMFEDVDGDVDIALRRNALGLRWDFVRRQALTVELSHVVSLMRPSDEVRIQWSGVIP
ncbi:MAG TPA: hypothetical protein VHY75_09725 [Steroidobacteraceae bacterium]|jgi:hypothetical protein|nr:hypothetical protein [Steroidobacteraceae bacterium]